MLEFILENKTTLLSVLAIIAAVRANLIANKSRKEAKFANGLSKQVADSQKQSELILEIESQDARFGTLQLILAQKLLFLQKYPNLQREFIGEYERLEKFLERTKKIRETFEAQRLTATKAQENLTIPQKESALTEIKRLSIRVNEDITKEDRGLNDFRSQITITNA